MADQAAGPSHDLREWMKLSREGQEVAFPRGPANLDDLLPGVSTIQGIERELREFVQGQSTQISEISVLLSIHLQWARQPDRLHPPPKAILIGPTGSGKTFTLRTAARFLGLPFVSVDTTSLVPSGIVGLQTEDVLRDLVAAADSILEQRSVQRGRDDDIRLAERGIIFLDEFDKIASAKGAHDAELLLQVQRRLLKLCEGSTASVGVRSHSGESTSSRSVDTSGILIIASGSFDGIEQLRARRPQSIARRPENRNVVMSVDLINYGFIPELIARLPVVVTYGKLTSKDLVAILKNETTTPLAVWRNYARSLGTRLVVEDVALKEMAERALELDLGARGLEQVVFRSLAKIAALRLGSGEGTPEEIRVEAADLV